VLSQHLRVSDDKARNELKGAKQFIQDPKIRTLIYTELAKQNTLLTENNENLNYADLIKAAHIIKGSAGSFGFNNLTNLAAQSLLLLRQKQYVQGIQHCINLQQKLVEILDEFND
jgi:HPt (histidine-containing phosphotransfer) domain-containing protein